MPGNNDKELLGIMIGSLEKYLKAAGRISKETFDELSEHKGLLWSEITEQKEILESLLDKLSRQDNLTKESAAMKADDVKVSSDKENGPINLFNKVVEFLKKQKCVELHWVKVYSVKYPQQGFKDFQIKYFEHKDDKETDKNYLMFGDTVSNFVIRKKGSEIIGDTAQCFDFILNLRDKLGIE